MDQSLRDYSFHQTIVSTKNIYRVTLGSAGTQAKRRLRKIGSVNPALVGASEYSGDADGR